MRPGAAARRHKHHDERHVGQRILAHAGRLQRIEDKVDGENQGDVFERQRENYSPEARAERVADARQGEQREQIGAENPDPEEQHRAVGRRRDVIMPEDERDMNGKRRREGEAELASVARQFGKQIQVPELCQRAAGVSKPEQEKAPPSGQPQSEDRAALPGAENGEHDCGKKQTNQEGRGHPPQHGNRSPSRDEDGETAGRGAPDSIRPVHATFAPARGEPVATPSQGSSKR